MITHIKQSRVTYGFLVKSPGRSYSSLEFYNGASINLCVCTNIYQYSTFCAGLWETTYNSSRLSVSERFHVNVFSTKTVTMKAASIPALMNIRRDGYFARAEARPKLSSEIDGNLQWFISSVITEIKDLHHSYGGESVSMVYCKTDFLKREIILKCSRGACSHVS